MIRLLREKIVSGEWSPGTRLPPLRRLANDFNISYNSVKRGIDHLAQLGLIRVQPGSGTFVAETNSVKRRGKRRLAVFMSAVMEDGKPGVYNTALLGAQKAAERADCALWLNYFPRDDASAERFSCESRGADGIVFLSEYDQSGEVFSFSIPAVGVCLHDVVDGNCSVVDLDPWTSAVQASDFFIKRGVEAVDVIFNDLPAYRHRGAMFALEWRRLGKQCREIRDLSELHWQEDRGYLFTTGSLSESCLRSVGDGIDVVKRHHILSLDGKSLIDPSFIPVPCVWVDWEAIGVQAVEECLERIERPGRGPRRVYAPGRLKELDQR